MLNINPSQLPELEPRHLGEKDLWKRTKMLKGCKRAMWRRWSREYVRGLCKRHVNAGGKQASCPRNGSAVIIADKSKNRNAWKLGIVTCLIKGKDNVVRGAKLQTVYLKGRFNNSIHLSCRSKKRIRNPTPRLPPSFLGQEEIRP